MKKEKMKNIISGFESEHELLMLEFDMLQDKHHEILQSVFSIQAALMADEKNPRRHRRVIARQRKQWPELWRQIDELMRVFEEQHSQK